MDMHQDEQWTAVARYLEGESSPEEQAAVRAWLAADPQNQKLFDLVAQMQPQRPSNLDVDAALKRAMGNGQSAMGKAHVWRRGLAIAAVLAMLVLGVYTIRNAVRGPALARSYVTAPGVTDSLLLADGTRAILGPGSQMVVPEDFGAGRREVSLAGEALFDVRRTGGPAFTVRTADALVRDISTTFTVRSDAESGTRVVVTSGAVLLGGDTVRAGQAASLSDGRVLVAAVDTTLALSWTRGRLVFDDAPLSEVAADLRRWYGLEMTIADSALARRRITATFAGEPLGQVLGIIATTLGVNVSLTGNTALVHPR